MSSSRHTPQRIYEKLTAAESLLAAGKSLAATSEELGVSSSTLKRWRCQYQGMDIQQIHSTLALSQKNRELQRKLAEQQTEGRMMLVLGKC